MNAVESQDLKTAFLELPRWLRYTTALLPLLSFGVGYAAQWHVKNAGLVLATLAGAQASVLAIVFAVTVLGIQLIAQEYSPRMIWLITKSPIFVFTFAVFVISVGFDLLLLANVSSAQNQVLAGLVSVSVGLGAVAVLSLYAFIQSAIDRLTPEGIVDAFLHELPSDTYYEQVQHNVESETARAHPIHPLYTMIMNGLSNRERVTVEVALQRYGQHAEEMLTTFIEQDRFSESSNNVSNQLFKPVLEEHLSEIALHAQEMDESGIASSAIDWQYKLGSKGLDTSNQRVARQAVSGLSDNLRDTPLSGDSYAVNFSSWRKLGELLKESADYPAPRLVWYILDTVEHNISSQLRKDVDPWIYNHAWLRLYRAFRDSHTTHLDHYAADIAEVDFDWQHESAADDLPHQEVMEAFSKFIKTYSAVNTDFLRYVSETDEYPIAEGNYRRNCYNVCVDASNTPAKEYARVLCQGLIEIAYILSYEKPDDESWWIDAVARVKYEGDPDVVDAAFEHILSYQQREGPGIWTVDEHDTYEQRYYQNLIRFQDYMPLNTHPDFPDRIKEFQEQVDEQWKQLENQ